MRLLGADNGAARGGRAGAGARARGGGLALDGERAVVVDLVALLDLERVVVAVGQGVRRSPDELAAGGLGGQGLDILEVGPETLAQDDGHGL